MSRHDASEPREARTMHRQAKTVPECCVSVNTTLRGVPTAREEERMSIKTMPQAQLAFRETKPKGDVLSKVNQASKPQMPTKLKSNVSGQHMAADFTSYTIKALNKVPTVLSRSEKDLLLFRTLTELLTGRTALLRMSKVGF